MMSLLSDSLNSFLCFTTHFPSFLNENTPVDVIQVCFIYWSLVLVFHLGLQIFDSVSITIIVPAGATTLGLNVYAHIPL